MSDPATPYDELPSAGLLRRAIAMVYDGLLVLAILLTTSGIANLFAARPEIAPDATTVSIEDMQTVTGPLLTSVMFVLTFTFFAFFWTRYGRTLGMQAWRLRVQDRDGHNISLRQALQRFVAAIPSLFLFGIGYFWALLDPAGLTWPDRLSGTRVVVLPRDHRS
ncbi:MAG: RDD family protein [Pseudomonadales bacterium]|jgi:uncharacterized RDD family membrane protein YckC|nr:RDD family protein [Pseudomonadales bacterium]